METNQRVFTKPNLDFSHFVGLQMALSMRVIFYEVYAVVIWLFEEIVTVTASCYHHVARVRIHALSDDLSAAIM